MVLYPRRRVPVRGWGGTSAPPTRRFAAGATPDSACLGLCRWCAWPGSGHVYARWENGSLLPRNEQGQREASPRSGVLACSWHGVAGTAFTSRVRDGATSLIVHGLGHMKGGTGHIEAC